MKTVRMQTFSCQSPDVLVLGAGISGLSCAYWLKQHGLDARVYEKDTRVGGAIRTYAQAHSQFEAGPNTLLANKEQLQWLKKLGLTVEYPAALSKNRYVLSNGQYKKLPSGLMNFVFGDFFSWKAKIQILSEPFKHNTPPSQPETMAHFFERRLGKEVVDKAINPFVGGVYAGDPNELLIEETIPILAEAERQSGSIVKGMLHKMRAKQAGKGLSRRNTYSLAGGLESLPKRLANHVNVSLNTPVEKIEAHAKGWKITGPTQSAIAPNVVLSVPAYIAADLIKKIDPHASIAFASIPYVPMSVVVSRFKRQQVHQAIVGFGGLNPTQEGAFSAGHLMTGDIFPERCAEDEMLITSFVGGRLYQAHALLPEAELLLNLNQELVELFDIEGEPLEQTVIRYEKCMPQSSVEVLAAKEAAKQLEKRGIYICANWLGGVSVPDCMNKGKAIADRIAWDSVLEP